MSLAALWSSVLLIIVLDGLVSCVQVDLENHHYRSFQGFVCLMQVSTRSEDFIVDTLALRSYISPCLKDIFADARIKKVFHYTAWSSLFSFHVFPSSIRSMTTKLWKVYFLRTVVLSLECRWCMGQIVILCGCRGTLAYTSATCLIPARSVVVHNLTE